eukprot:TRINITY_DN723_c0_g1_i1.p1 TRINITY_DN723_c0_g1~~TRINITY_DN723_c0_g1_i1.p1  ORF type:complete len:768 (+),score=236.19 TRINITY_DN723_c0_g1_i1:92-2305(+)
MDLSKSEPKRAPPRLMIPSTAVQQKQLYAMTPTAKRTSKHLPKHAHDQSHAPALSQHASAQSSLLTLKKSSPMVGKSVPIRSAGDLKELLSSTELHDVLSSCLSEVRKVYRMRTMVHADGSKDRPITSLTLEEVPNVFDTEEGSVSEFQTFVNQVESYEAGLPAGESSSSGAVGRGVLADHFAMKSLEQAFSDLECRLKASHEVIRKLYTSNESLLEENRMLRKELKMHSSESSSTSAFTGESSHEDTWKGVDDDGSEHVQREAGSEEESSSPSMTRKCPTKPVTIENLIEEIQSMRATQSTQSSLSSSSSTACRKERKGRVQKGFDLHDGNDDDDDDDEKVKEAAVGGSGLDEEIRISRMEYLETRRKMRELEQQVSILDEIHLRDWKAQLDAATRSIAPHNARSITGLRDVVEQLETKNRTLVGELGAVREKLRVFKTKWKYGTPLFARTLQAYYAERDQHLYRLYRLLRMADGYLTSSPSRLRSVSAPAPDLNAAVAAVKILSEIEKNLSVQTRKLAEGLDSTSTLRDDTHGEKEYDESSSAPAKLHQLTMVSSMLRDVAGVLPPKEQKMMSEIIAELKSRFRELQIEIGCLQAELGASQRRHEVQVIKYVTERSLLQSTIESLRNAMNVPQSVRDSRSGSPPLIDASTSSSVAGASSLDSPRMTRESWRSSSAASSSDRREMVPSPPPVASMSRESESGRDTMERDPVVDDADDDGYSQDSFESTPTPRGGAS